MQTNYISAIFESGTLRPLAPLDLNEHEQVQIAIIRAGASTEESDEGYMPIIAAEADAAVTLEQVQHALAKLSGSLVNDFARHRDKRF
jgi:predicted DNA-binding antitoxin AbrB/MazE fold protein